MVGACALVLSVTGAARAYDAVEVKNGGTISGQVKFTGAAPAKQKLTVDKDTEVCGKNPIFSEAIVVGAGGELRNAVVYLANITKGKAFDGAAPVFDQNGCAYAPHVVTAAAGAAIDVLNNDGILHNIHTYSSKNAPLNLAQPKFKKKMNMKFDKPEFIKVACDAHSWMNGQIVVQEHPYYAVSDDNGAFKLTDVPPGDYELKVWHETLGEKTQKVTVKAGDEAKVTFELAKQ